MKGAQNIPDVTEIGRRFMLSPIVNKRVAIVFYCEFSSKRGPTGYRHLRRLDREANQENYPKVGSQIRVG